MKSIFAGITLVFSLSQVALAGAPGGPRLLWVNIEGYQPATDIVKNFVESQPEDLYCGDNGYGLAFYIRQRPVGVTNDLVKRALIDGSRDARKNLIRYLKDFQDKDIEIDDGLDGVIAFENVRGYHLISMDMRGRIQRSGLISIKKPETLTKALCGVTPIVYRDHG